MTQKKAEKEKWNDKNLKEQMKNRWQDVKLTLNHIINYTRSKHITHLKGRDVRRHVGSPTIYTVHKKDHLNINTNMWKLNRWKYIYHANCEHRTSGVTILVSDHVDFKTELITKDTEVYFIRFLKRQLVNKI